MHTAHTNTRQVSRLTSSAILVCKPHTDNLLKRVGDSEDQKCHRQKSGCTFNSLRAPEDVISDPALGCVRYGERGESRHGVLAKHQGVRAVTRVIDTALDARWAGGRS